MKKRSEMAMPCKEDSKRTKNPSREMLLVQIRTKRERRTFSLSTKGREDVRRFQSVDPEEVRVKIKANRTAERIAIVRYLGCLRTIPAPTKASLV